MMNNTFNFGEPSGGGFIDTHFDFKQCQRSDGTIYGVPNTSDCAMKGAKEVKSTKKKSSAAQASTSFRPLLAAMKKMSPEFQEVFLPEAKKLLKAEAQLAAGNSTAARKTLKTVNKDFAEGRKFTDFWSAKQELIDSLDEGVKRLLKEADAAEGITKPKPRRPQQSRPMSAQEMTAAIEGALGSAGVTPGLMGAMRGSSTEVGVTGWQGRNINDPRGAVTCKGGICSDKTGSWPDPNRARN